jgi:cobalt/nickel transport protein
MKRYQNLLLLSAVGILILLPFWTVEKPTPLSDGTKIELFRGSDDKATDVIHTLAPEYKPWVTPLMEPRAETSTLLFALQAALGAGFIGYYLKRSISRAKVRRKNATVSQC